MNTKLKEIFSEVRAEEELKNRTKAFLAQKMERYAGAKAAGRRRFAAACACLLLMLAGGQWLWLTPTAEISIEINPSLELGVNRWNQVVAVSGRNRDGQELADELDVMFRRYTDALDRILEHERIAALLSGNEIMTITVTGRDGAQSAGILSGVEGCTVGQRNAYCYAASPEEAAAARELGLSYGKYRVFLEIRKLDPEIAPESVQDMTMRELRNLLDTLSAGGENPAPSEEYGGCGSGSGPGGGQGRGKARSSSV